jgi:hypothetical protein
LPSCQAGPFSKQTTIVQSLRFLVAAIETLETRKVRRASGGRSSGEIYLDTLRACLVALHKAGGGGAGCPAKTCRWLEQRRRTGKMADGLQRVATTMSREEKNDSEVQVQASER